MRKDVREFIRRLETVGLTVESTPGHYRVPRDGKPLRKGNGMPFSSYVWHRIAPYLAEQGQVFLFDLLGYGQSEQRNEQDVSLEHWRWSVPR